MRHHCLYDLQSCYLCLRRRNKSHQPLILSFLLPFLWLWMVCVESGPCASGTTLCFICTAMLDTGTRIPMLSVKNPSLLSPPPPPVLNFYFKMPSGPSLCKCILQGTALCISCSSIRANQQRKKGRTNIQLKPSLVDSVKAKSSSVRNYVSLKHWRKKIDRFDP